MTDAIRAEFRRQLGGLVAMAVACTLFLAWSKRFLDVATVHSRALSISGPGLVLGLVCASVAAALCAIFARSSTRSQVTPLADSGETNWVQAWTAQCCVGGAFAVGLACLIASLVFLVFLKPNPEMSRWFLFVLYVHGFLFVALEAFAWGTFWSRPARSPILILSLIAISLTLIWLVSTIVSGWSSSAVALRPILACIVLYLSWRATVLETYPEPKGRRLLRVLAWKEMREHRFVWLTMAAVNVAIMVATRRLLADDRMPLYLQLRFLTVMVVPAVYGLVCAGLMLTGETENHTLSCLDALMPVRTELWKRKCALGAFFTAGQALLCGCFRLSPTLLLTGDLTADLVDVASKIAPVVLFALTAFAVGMATSVFSQTVLAAVAWGTVAVAVLGWILADPLLSWGSSPIELVLVCGAIASAALFTSWLGFCRDDRSRQELSDGDPAESAEGLYHGADVVSIVAAALGFGAAVAIAILFTAGCVLTPLFSSSQAGLAATVIVWLIVPVKSLVNALSRGAPGRSQSPGTVRTEKFQAMFSAAALAGGVFFVNCLIVLDSKGTSANPFPNAPIMQILPSAAVLFTSWWLLCRRSQGARSPAIPAWLLAAWMLFAGAEVSAYARESRDATNRSPASRRAVTGVARTLSLSDASATTEARRDVLQLAR